MAHQRAPRRTLILIAGMALLLGACAGTKASADTTRTGRTARLAASSSSSGSRTVTVDATGKVRAVPDQLVAHLGIHTTGPTAAGVLSDANIRARAVLDLLKAQGVDAKDVQTAQVDLGPTFNPQGVVTGFAADNEMVITFRNLAIAGRQLDAVARAPGDASRLESVSLGFNNDDQLLAAARVDGVRRAKAQATQMVGALDANLGAVQTITETSTPSQPTPRAVSNGLSTSDTSVPIAPGTQDLTVSVRVVFQIG